MNTVFVIGAGASAEIGMPVGNELKKNITKFLNQKDRPTETAIKQAIDGSIMLFSNEKGYDFSNLRTVADKITTALPLAESIDNYLNAHKGNKEVEVVGKIGIVYSILHAEAYSKLKNTSVIPFTEIEKTWYTALFKKIIQGCQIEQFKEKLKEITFITFNYDRSLEYYLYHAIQTYFDISAEQSKSIVNDIYVYHPYGQAGFLPFQDGPDFIEYGELPSAQQVYTFSKQIKTFMEGVDANSDTYKKIVNSLVEANRVIFLGFAYYKQNIDLLYPQKIHMWKKVNGTTPPFSSASIRQGAVQYYGTVLGFSENELSTIRRQIQSKDERVGGNTGVELYSGNCYDFFSKEYIQRIEF
ncbi:hypothetical protein FACS1894130_07950 [Spirochaetia bacterium]|nr:hypothetical protein FACS1894130_07950 [Spirochaetia bacterium]